jgi:PASTA domain
MSTVPPILDQRYGLSRYLRRGVLGPVWLAQTARIHGQHVELEFLDEELSGDLERMHRFRDLLRPLTWLWFNHPVAAPILELTQLSRAPCVVMKHIQGVALSHRLASGRPFPPEEALAMGQAVAGLLTHAHAAGLAHGGLTVDTVVMTPEGDVRTLDFGLAAAWQESAGKPRKRGESELARLRRKDVMDLGALLGQLLTGRVSGASDEASGEEEDDLAPPPLPAWLPAAFTSSWRKMLEAGADSRWREAFLSQLSSLSKPSEPEPTPARPSPPPARQPLLTASTRPDPPQPDRAQPDPSATARPPIVVPAVPRRLLRLRLLMRTMVVGLVVAVAVTAMVLALFLRADEGDVPRPGDTRLILPNPPDSVSGSGSADLPLVVPEVTGLPVIAARARLIGAGLLLEAVLPVMGPAGKVVGSIPSAGVAIQAGDGVTLLVGSPADRQSA